MSRSLLFALLLATAPAMAATPIDEVRPLSPDGQVRIENIKGRVTVTAWDRDEVRIGGTLGDGVERLRVDGNRGELRIEVVYPNRGGWFSWWGSGDRAGPSELEVRVPAGASVAVETVSAGVAVAGTGGRRLAVETVSGDVTVRDARAGEVRLETVSGDVRAAVDTGDLGIDTVSGDLEIEGAIGGRIRIDSVSGDVRLHAGRAQRLDFSSVSGDGRLRTGLADGGTITADSVSGRLALVVPRDVSARLRVETFSGDIRSPVGQVETEQFGPGRSLRARLGGGEGDIRLESFSGSVSLEFEGN